MDGEHLEEPNGQVEADENGQHGPDGELAGWPVAVVVPVTNSHKLNRILAGLAGNCTLRADAGRTGTRFGPAPSSLRPQNRERRWVSTSTTGSRSRPRGFRACGGSDGDRRAIPSTPAEVRTRPSGSGSNCGCAPPRPGG